MNIRVIDNKVDFESYNELPYRQNEEWLKMIPLKPKTFTDGGYRFVKNSVHRDDSWMNMFKKKVFSFYHVKLFNHDIMETKT